ncbi:phosphoribosyltransferase [Litchfieldella rifensis]|uniref:Phosphoribosyltransferase n=1 Tax=Litchfieldella rifensis TaxID=762643 RepID=A0ABV7LRH3_9GAMM
MSFKDRHDAGKRLAEALSSYRQTPDLLVLALPRGGVPVAWEVAQALDAELDVLVVRKLGVPWQPELAMGAIAGNGVRVLHDDMVSSLRIPEDEIEDIVRDETTELKRREASYRGDRPKPRIQDRTVIVVDDGLATGATMQAAVQALREQSPARITVAVPVSPPDSADDMKRYADEVVCLMQPPGFGSVGQWYQHFGQTSDDEVKELLGTA